MPLIRTASWLSVLRLRKTAFAILPFPWQFSSRGLWPHVFCKDTAGASRLTPIAKRSCARGQSPYAGTLCAPRGFVRPRRKKDDQL